MAARHMVELVESHYSGDRQQFRSAALRMAAHEARLGHKTLANEIKELVLSENVRPQGQPLPGSTSGVMSPLDGPPTSQCLSAPFFSTIPRERLRHHMVLPQGVEQRFHKVEQEYIARDRLGHYGLKFSQKVLLHGPHGCGKTLGAERLAWNIGLPVLKVGADAMVSSCLKETASNLRQVFEVANQQPCLLFVDNCDAIIEVTTFLQLLDEWDSMSGLLVAAINLNESLDPALWQRFDSVIEIPKPGRSELEIIVRQSLSAMDVVPICWEEIISPLYKHGFSAAQAIRVAQEAAKRAVLDREEPVSQEHLEGALEGVIASNLPQAWGKS